MREKLIYFHKESAFGPYWSVTTFDHIMAVDRNNGSFPRPAVLRWLIKIRTYVPGFITADQPKHGPRRKAVQNVVAPKNLQNLEALIRHRAAEILDNLPVGEVFNWVDAVSINLTTQMLATLFDFPFAEREKLTLWSDNFTSGSPRHDVEHRKARQKIMLECLDYFQALWHQRKTEPTNGFDLITCCSGTQPPPTWSMTRWSIWVLWDC